MPEKAKASRTELIELLPRLRRFAFALTGSRHDGDDLLQATVERLLERGLPADADLGKWSFRVCRNLWIDEVRARKVRASAQDAISSAAPASEDGERVIMNRVTLVEVNDAMATLNEEQRLALSLVTLEGLSYAEAAEVLEVPVGTIMSRIARARRALSDRFKDAAPSAGAGSAR